MKSDALKGQLELVVLATLRDGPLHGYAIIKGTAWTDTRATSWAVRLSCSFTREPASLSQHAGS